MSPNPLGFQLCLCRILNSGRTLPHRADSTLWESIVPSTSLRARILNRRAQAADETVSAQAARLQATPGICQLLDALPHPLLVLNSDRRIVFTNRALLDMLGSPTPEQVYGLLPGEVLDCGHAWADGHTCGQTDACRLCGAFRAFGLSEQKAGGTQECRISQTTGASLDLRATSTPFFLAGEAFTVLSLADISDEKRRQVLERVFFHDLLNLTAGVMGYAELLARVPREEIPEISRLLARMVRELADEIRSHRDLALAEARDLKVHWEQLNTREMLTTVIESCRKLEAAEGRTILLHLASADIAFPSDRSLLSRVLANMLKNALEASSPGQIITIGCDANSERVDFWVHNDGAMPADVQLQIFQRSFSTKGVGRGVGTYSIKLLTERYLNGQASFTSTLEAGTIFTVSYPLTRLSPP
jgi:PAS domain-containing protein